ncbi:hypothetical protein C8F01DRAFT_1009287 [Mycena amicta]|nr:hypothetical protein C8F01DRAFT_1009287 [Mycena amicta]
MKFSAANQMDPGPAPNLPVLTQMEEILISPVHALTQVWQIHGGQYAYRRHVCNFPRDTSVFHNRVPLLPEECDIIVFRRKGSVEGDEGDKIKENFRVRQDVLRQWLQYLEQHHPTFHSRQVHIDWDILNSLPKNGNVLQRVQSISTEDLNSNPDEGPPVENQQPDGSGLFSAQFAVWLDRV